MDYEIGQIFEGMYPPEAAAWCNENHMQIDEIDPIVKRVEEEYEDINNATGLLEMKKHTVEKTFRRFQITPVSELTTEEDKVFRIAKLKALLASHEYWTSKHADGEYTEEEWAEKVAQRKAWRAEIKELEGE